MGELRGYLQLQLDGPSEAVENSLLEVRAECVPRAASLYFISYVRSLTIQLLSTHILYPPSDNSFINYDSNILYRGQSYGNQERGRTSTEEQVDICKCINVEESGFDVGSTSSGLFFSSPATTKRPPLLFLKAPLQQDVQCKDPAFLSHFSHGNSKF